MLRERCCKLQTLEYLVWIDFLFWYSRDSIKVWYRLWARHLASKGITDLNVKHKTIKLLVKSIEENFQDVGLGKKFLELTPKT